MKFSTPKKPLINSVMQSSRHAIKDNATVDKKPCKWGRKYANERRRDIFGRSAFHNTPPSSNSCERKKTFRYWTFFVVVFFYRVLPSFTGFYLVFIGFLGFLHGLAQFLVLRSAQRRLATEPLFLPSFTEFYRVLPSFTGFYWIWLGLTYFHGILPGIIKFFFVLLVFFSRFSLLGFAQFHWVASTFDRLYVTTTLVTSFNWFYWVSPHHNGFYPDFLGFLGFYLVLLGLNLIDWIVSISFFTGSWWIQPQFTALVTSFHGFDWVSWDRNGFYPDFPGFPRVLLAFPR